jgi:hypothetical protein
MSIDALQLRHEIIRPVLKHLDPVIPYSMAAENLLMGTCAQESRMGQWLVQLDHGPAKGIFQMETNTENDIWYNYIKYRNDLSREVSELCALPKGDRDPLIDEMSGNLYYAAAMCRVHYYRVPMALPDADNVEELAHYWKLYYNTPEGKGTVEEFVKNYELFVA